MTDASTADRTDRPGRDGREGGGGADADRDGPLADVDASDPVAVSTAFLRAVRAGDDRRVRAARQRVAGYDPGELLGALDGDDARTAFWINVYNALSQVLLDEHRESYERSRRKFFGRELATVAGRSMSLNDVENGILRRSRPVWTFGYVSVPDLFVDEFERRARVDELDPRLHFALNCGAASCPPIAAYTREGIDDELDLATASYLETAVEYDAEAGRVSLPRIFLWFRGDFGGKRGILELLREYDVVPEDASPSLKHRSYDWSLDLGNFREDGFGD